MSTLKARLLIVLAVIGLALEGEVHWTHSVTRGMVLWTMIVVQLTVLLRIFGNGDKFLIAAILSHSLFHLLVGLFPEVSISSALFKGVAWGKVPARLYADHITRYPSAESDNMYNRRTYHTVSMIIFAICAAILLWSAVLSVN